MALWCPLDEPVLAAQDLLLRVSCFSSWCDVLCCDGLQRIVRWNSIHFAADAEDGTCGTGYWQNAGFMVGCPDRRTQLCPLRLLNEKVQPRAEQLRLLLASKGPSMEATSVLSRCAFKLPSSGLTRVCHCKMALFRGPITSYSGGGKKL